ncbi:hypothetical protein [Nocardioides rubriscoriae]|uniref:hypothetical protein n=1 Tax=Nocardioides rubriscoriae TaxID=642762 RepID=UPI0011E02544|nr:hypothetical protein [Nocardioides rubriscoriae]
MTGRQALYLHIGMPKSGSTYLQSLLEGHRPALRARGYTYPDAGREAMFHAALEMAGRPDQWGLTDEAVAGAFDRVLDAGRRGGGTVLVSHEILSAATRKEIDRIGERLEEFDLHVVVTTRDLARTVAAQWQERVKNGVDETYAQFAEAVLAQRPADMTSTAQGFWHGHNVPWVLTRWERLVPPDRVHVVVTPDRSAGPGALWTRFAAAVGLPADVLDPLSGAVANESLGTAQVALLRQTLAASGLEQPWTALVGKRWFAQTILSRARSARPVTPAPVAAALAEVAETWIAELGSRGYAIHGSLDELRPSTPPPGTPHPDDVSADDLVRDLPDLLGAMLRHEVDQRQTIARLEAELREARQAPSRRSRWSR